MIWLADTVQCEDLKIGIKYTTQCIDFCSDYTNIMTSRGNPIKTVAYNIC